MITYKLILAYVGTHYRGWQVQAQGHDKKTVQGEINKALEIITKGGNFSTLASGRTDAGVHALGQVCRLQMDLKLEERNLIMAMNSNLPEDIRVVKAEVREDNFHPIKDAKIRCYSYLFTAGHPLPSPLAKKLIGVAPYPLDEEKMLQAASLFVGKHDFKNFYCLGSNIRSTWREIFQCRLTKIDKSFHFPEHYKFQVEGEGFLKQMVRLMVGALWAVGHNEVTLEQLEDRLNGRTEGHLTAVASPSGLYKEWVSF